MLVEELIEQLGLMDKDAEVLFAWQQNYPMESSVGPVIQIDPNSLTQDELDEIETMVDDEFAEGDLTDDQRSARRQELTDERIEQNGIEIGVESVVYIGEDRHIGYLSSLATENLGW